MYGRFLVRWYDPLPGNGIFHLKTGHVCGKVDQAWKFPSLLLQSGGKEPETKISKTEKQFPARTASLGLCELIEDVVLLA